MIQTHLGLVLPLTLHLAQLVTTMGTTDLDVTLHSIRKNSYLLQKGLHLSKIANDRLTRNVANILRMIVGGGFVQLLLGLTGINSLQNANTTTSEDVSLLPTENPSTKDQVYEWPAISSCTR